MHEQEPISQTPAISIETKEGKKIKVPDWLGFQNQEEVDKITNPELRETISFFAGLPEEMLGRGGVIREHYLKLHNKIFKGKIDENEATLIMSALAKKHEELQTKGRKRKQSAPEKAKLEPEIEELVRIRTGIEQMATVSAEQLEALRGGYDALVSAESAQAGLNTELFDTQPPVWYRRLNPEWKDVIRNRLYILLGCYVKRKVGHLELDPVAGNQQIRIERDALDNMWKEMPGFRVALTTMFNDFFELRRYIPPFVERKNENKILLLKITPEGVENLQNFANYKQKMIIALADYLRNEGKDLLEKNPLTKDPKIAAEAAFSAAWNLIYVGNAIESADFGKIKSKRTSPEEEKKEKYERELTNPIIYAEQIRASFLPGMKARGKFIRREPEKIGTDEAWLGSLGEYIAERARHNGKAGRNLEEKSEVLVPERLFASFFDLIQFEEEEKDEEGNITTIKTSIAKKIMTAAWQSEIVEKHIKRSQEEEESKKEGKIEKKSEVVYLCVPDKNMVDFSQLKHSELWGGYADTWDSAKKIYDALSGKISPEKPDVWSQIVSNAFSKMRNSGLAPIYNTEELIEACIAGSFGLTPGTDEKILNIPEDSYDSILWHILKNDRFYAGLKPEARKRILRYFMAQDFSKAIDVFYSVLPGIMHQRKQERMLAARRLAKLIRKK